MVSDVCHWRELNSQGEKGGLLAIFLLSIATVLTKSIIETQNSLFWPEGDNSSKSHFCGNSFQQAVVLRICCWQSSSRFTVSGTKNVLCKFGEGQWFLIPYELSQDFWGLSIITYHSIGTNSAGFGYFPKAEWCKNINNLLYWPFMS